MEEKDKFGRTKLHYVSVDVESTLQAEVATELIKNGANVNNIDINGNTSLHSAASHNCYDLAKVLIEAGALIDAKDNNGNTPLSNAVFSSEGDGELIILLRENGADPYLVNFHGVSPVILARSVANYDIAKYFKDLPE